MACKIVSHFLFWGLWLDDFPKITADPPQAIATWLSHMAEMWRDVRQPHDPKINGIQ